MRFHCALVVSLLFIYANGDEKLKEPLVDTPQREAGVTTDVIFTNERCDPQLAEKQADPTDATRYKRCGGLGYYWRMPCADGTYFSSFHKDCVPPQQLQSSPLNVAAEQPQEAKQQNQQGGYWMSDGAEPERQMLADNVTHVNGPSVPNTVALESDSAGNHHQVPTEGGWSKEAQTRRDGDTTAGGAPPKTAALTMRGNLPEVSVDKMAETSDATRQRPVAANNDKANEFLRRVGQRQQQAQQLLVQQMLHSIGIGKEYEPKSKTHVSQSLPPQQQEQFRGGNPSMSQEKQIYTANGHQQAPSALPTMQKSAGVAQIASEQHAIDQYSTNRSPLSHVGTVNQLPFTHGQTPQAFGESDVYEKYVHTGKLLKDCARGQPCPYGQHKTELYCLNDADTSRYYQCAPSSGGGGVWIERRCPRGLVFTGKYCDRGADHNPPQTSQWQTTSGDAQASGNQLAAYYAQQNQQVAPTNPYGPTAHMNSRPSAQQIPQTTNPRTAFPQHIYEQIQAAQLQKQQMNRGLVQNSQLYGQGQAVPDIQSAYGPQTQLTQKTSQNSVPPDYNSQQPHPVQGFSQSAATNRQQLIGYQTAPKIPNTSHQTPQTNSQGQQSDYMAYLSQYMSRLGNRQPPVNRRQHHYTDRAAVRPSNPASSAEWPQQFPKLRWPSHAAPPMQRGRPANDRYRHRRRRQPDASSDLISEDDDQSPELFDAVVSEEGESRRRRRPRQRSALLEGSECDVRAAAALRLQSDATDESAYYMCLNKADVVSADRDGVRGTWVRMICPIDSAFDPATRLCVREFSVQI